LGHFNNFKKGIGRDTLLPFKSLVQGVKNAIFALSLRRVKSIDFQTNPEEFFRRLRRLKIFFGLHELFFIHTVASLREGN